MPTPSVEGELLAWSLNEELHDVVAPADLATSVIEQPPAGPSTPAGGARPAGGVPAAVAVVLAVVLPTVNRAATTPRWTLVGDVSPSWHETPSQGLTQSFSLTCPSATTCYVPGPSGVEATRDGGKTWAVGAGVPTPLSLPEPCNLRQRQHVRGACVERRATGGRCSWKPPMRGKRG